MDLIDLPLRYCCDVNTFVRVELDLRKTYMAGVSVYLAGHDDRYACAVICVRLQKTQLLVGVRTCDNVDSLFVLYVSELFG